MSIITKIAAAFKAKPSSQPAMAMSELDKEFLNVIMQDANSRTRTVPAFTGPRPLRRMA